MALADYTAYKDAILAPSQRVRSTSAAIGGVTGRYTSLWTNTPDPGASPGGNVAPTNATAGCIGQRNGGTAALWIAAHQTSRDRGGARIIADRLVHTDGLSGTVATAQTTNLPTTPLTRYTNGVGVLAAIEIYGALGTTATTFTCSYTNSAGTAGRTSPAYPVGSTTYNQVGRFLIMPMQAGDVGVKSVESVTLALSTGTAGNFGVTLFKPLASYFYSFTFAEAPVYQDALLSGGGQLPEAVDNACLWFIEVLNTTATAISHTELTFIEG
jgi:hypothetical protein